MYNPHKVHAEKHCVHVSGGHGPSPLKRVSAGQACNVHIFGALRGVACTATTTTRGIPRIIVSGKRKVRPPALYPINDQREQGRLAVLAVAENVFERKLKDLKSTRNDDIVTRV
jgi:hypothetical protein